MKKKRTYEQIREQAKRSVEHAAEETERLSSMKPDLAPPVSRARWSEQPAPVKRAEKKRVTYGLILNAIMLAWIMLLAVPAFLIVG